MTTLPDRKLLRVDEVAAFFRVSRHAVYRWIREDRLEVTQTPGGTFRILRSSVLRAEEEGKSGKNGKG